MDNERIRKMAKPDQIREWYRGVRPRAITPTGSWANDTRALCYYRFDSAEYRVIRQQRDSKDAVRDGVTFYSALHGPHDFRTREKWFRDCALKRKLIVSLPADRDKFIREHRRTISAIRSSRFVNTQRMAGVSPYPFYVEPNTNFITFDELGIAEKHGHVFTRLRMRMSLSDYLRISRRLQKSGRMSDIWSSDYNEEGEHIDDKVDAIFVFVNPEQADILAEELVWIKLRY